MNKREISIYHHPNPEMKSFLTREDISAMRVEHFKGSPDNISDAALHSLGPIGSRVVKEIFKIPGIREIRIKPKEILVKKEGESLWADIEPLIIETLERSLRRKKIKVVKRTAP